MLQFQNLIPTPMKEVATKSDGFWHNEIKIEKGERVLLNAASGKGKTSFTHIVAGIRHDYEGRFFIQGKDAKLLSNRDWTKIRSTEIAFIFQDLQLFPQLTLLENLKLKSEITNFTTEKEIISFVERLGLSTHLHQQAGILSMGQQQRVAIIRGLLQPFSLLIMDEPFSHLDAENTRLAMELIDERRKEQNAGFVLTTLDPTRICEFDTELFL